MELSYTVLLDIPTVVVHPVSRLATWICVASNDFAANEAITFLVQIATREIDRGSGGHEFSASDNGAEQMMHP
jgi:hypothetical protein